MDRQHDIKVGVGPFNELTKGTKTFLAQPSEFHFSVGDTLHIREYNAGNLQATGRWLLREVIHIAEGYPIASDWVVLGLKVVKNMPVQESKQLIEIGYAFEHRLEEVGELLRAEYHRLYKLAQEAEL